MTSITNIFKNILSILSISDESEVEDTTTGGLTTSAATTTLDPGPQKHNVKVGIRKNRNFYIREYTSRKYRNF